MVALRWKANLLGYEQSIVFEVELTDGRVSTVGLLIDEDP
jgi:hypothetical protein